MTEALSLTTWAGCISDYRGNVLHTSVCHKNAEKDSRASKESMFTGISLTRSLYKLHRVLMRWDNWFDFKQSVQINKSVEQYSAFIPTTQIRAGPTYAPSSSSASSSAVSLSCTVLTRGDVRWIIRVRTDSLVLVTTMAASPGHWLTVYVSGEIVY